MALSSIEPLGLPGLSSFRAGEDDFFLCFADFTTGAGLPTLEVNSLFPETFTSLESPPFPAFSVVLILLGAVISPASFKYFFV
eukprot:Gb_13829 [translate_table: standard]